MATSDLQGESQLIVKGGYYLTDTVEGNQSEFAGGVEITDVYNSNVYNASSVSGGLMLGNPNGQNTANITDLGYGLDSDSSSNITRGAVTGFGDNPNVTTADLDSLNTTLENTFDVAQVSTEIDAQQTITQAFDQERRHWRTEMRKKEDELRATLKVAEQAGNEEIVGQLNEQINEMQQNGLLFDSITGALYGPNATGAIGYGARAVSPFVANQIGRVFKDNEASGDGPGVNSLEHILAHTIWGAAVSLATGNDALTGGVSAGVNERGAAVLSDYLYGTVDPSKLTPEQKDTLSSIIGLVGLGIGTTTDDVSDAVNAGESGRVAVDDNGLNVLEDHCLNWTDCTQEFQNQGATSRPTQMYNGQWRLIEYRNDRGDTIGYTAYNTSTNKVDFLVRNNEIQDFMNATPTLIENTVGLAKLTENNPAALNQMQMSIMHGDFSGYLQAWKDGLEDPYFVALVSMNFLGSGAGSMASKSFTQSELKQLANMSGTLRAASRGKGNFGLGQATRNEAVAMGRAWAGHG